jgi:hypothetical protein
MVRRTQSSAEFCQVRPVVDRLPVLTKEEKGSSPIILRQDASVPMMEVRQGWKEKVPTSPR